MEAGIYHGNAFNLINQVESDSVDLILTDPVYSNLKDYAWLAESAKRVLKHDRACLAWYGGSWLAEIKKMMERYLTWTWLLNYVVVAKSNKLIGYNIFTWTTHCLWFRKGKGFPLNRIPDTFISHKRPSGNFKWQKNLGVLRYWITAFTKKDDIILDPFCGHGAVPVACRQTGRKCIAFEINRDRVSVSKNRYDKAQVPLIPPEAEQLSMQFSE